MGTHTHRVALDKHRRVLGEPLVHVEIVAGTA